MTTSAPGLPSRGRLLGLDLARGFAVVLALLAHCFAVFRFWPSVPGYPDLQVTLVTRAATPLFVVLFGVMLEIVYVRRVGEVGMRTVTFQLWSRALTCWALFGLTTASALLAGNLSLSRSLRTLVLLDTGYYSVILKFYAVFLLVAPLLVYLRLRWGSASLLLIPAAAWLVSELLLPRSAGGNGLAGLASFVAGIGVSFSPSLLHGTTFVVAGMLLGRARRPPGVRSYRDLVPVLVLLVTALAVIAVELDRVGLLGFLQNLQHRSAGYRWTNHPAYYAYGILIAVVVMLSTEAAVRLTDPEGSSWIFMVGRNTLFAYALGNIALSLIPRPSHNVLGTAGTVALIVAFLSAIVWVTSLHDRLKRGGSLTPLERWLFAPISLVTRLWDRLLVRLVDGRSSGSSSHVASFSK